MSGFRRPSLLFTDAYRAVVRELLLARREAGVTQRQLAATIGRAHSHVVRIEQGQRRVEILEFCRIAEALGVDPVVLFARVHTAARAAEAGRGETAD